MPTLSMIKTGNKCAFTYLGSENEITRMLTQCALRDELLAEAITQSAMHINRDKMEYSNPDQTDQQPGEKEIFYFSLNADNSIENRDIQKS